MNNFYTFLFLEVLFVLPLIIFDFILFLCVMVTFILWKIYIVTKIKKTYLEEQIQNNIDSYKKLEKIELSSKMGVNNELINIISGVNHEVSPWLGSINNIIECLDEEFSGNYLKRFDKQQLTEYIMQNLDDIKKASEQSINILSSISFGIKKFRNYSIFYANIYETLKTWLYLVIYSQSFKGIIDSTNIHLEKETLDFHVQHSQMLLSQILINLIKNTIEHNKQLEPHQIRIHIWGDANNKKIIYQDNGIGIPDNIKKEVCLGNYSSKDLISENTGGIGMASIVSYCNKMGASLEEIGEYGKGVMFVITFEKNLSDSSKVTKSPVGQGSGGYYNLEATSIHKLK